MIVEWFAECPALKIRQRVTVEEIDLLAREEREPLKPYRVWQWPKPYRVVVVIRDGIYAAGMIDIHHKDPEPVILFYGNDETAYHAVKDEILPVIRDTVPGHRL